MIYQKIQDDTITPRFDGAKLCFWLIWYENHKKEKTIKKIENLYKEKKFEPAVAFIKYPVENYPDKNDFPVLFFITTFNTRQKGKQIVKTLNYRCRRSARNRQAIIACKDEDHKIIDRLSTLCP